MLNSKISVPIKIFLQFLILSGSLFAAASTDPDKVGAGQMDKQLPEIEITNAPKTPIFEKTTFTFKFRVKDSQNKRVARGCEELQAPLRCEETKQSRSKLKQSKAISSLLRKPPSLTYSWRLDYKEWSSPPSPSPREISNRPDKLIDSTYISRGETSVLLNAEDLTVGMHRFQVRIEDEDGNVGPSAVALFKVIPDLQPPDTKITTVRRLGGKMANNPLAPFIKGEGQEGELEFEGNDPQTPKEKLQYSWRIDLGKWSEFSFQTSVYLPNLKDGVHSFEVKAKDESGNEDTTPAKVLFEVARQEPDTMIIEPPEIIEASDVTFRFSGTDLQTPREKLEYSWRLDNQKWTPFSTKTIAELTNLSNGMHQFNVKARDEDKNEDSSPTKVVFKVAVNTELPETKITEIISEPDGNFTFHFKGTDLQTPNELQYSWRVGGEDWFSFSSETTVHLSGLTEGKYRFQVKAKDANGNEDPTPVEASFEVVAKKQIPETEIINPPVNAVVLRCELAKQSRSNLPPIVPLEIADSHKTAFESAETQTSEGKRARGQEGKGEALVSEAKAVSEPKAEGVGEPSPSRSLPLNEVKGSRVEGKLREPKGEVVGELRGGTTKQTEHFPRTYIKTNQERVRKADIEIEFYGEDERTPKRGSVIASVCFGSLATSPATLSTGELVYAWKLDDNDWSFFSKNTTVRLKNLNEGLHTFRVKAKNPQGNEDSSPPKYIFIVDLPVSRNLIVIVTLFILPALSAGYYLFYRWRQRQPRIIAAKIYPKLKKNLQIVLSVMYEICERQAAIEIFQYLFKSAMKKNAPQIAVAADIFAAILSKPTVPIDGLSERIQGLTTLGGAEAEAFHGYLLNLSEAAEASAISEITIQGRFLLQRISEPSFPDFILKNSEKVLEKMKELLEHLSNFERRGDAWEGVSAESPLRASGDCFGSLATQAGLSPQTSLRGTDCFVPRKSIASHASERLIYLEKANDFCNQARVLVEQQLAQPDKTLFNFLFTQWMRAISATREKMVFFIGKVDVLL